MDELTAWLTLVRAPGLHAGKLRPLLQHFGSPVHLLRAPKAQLLACGVQPPLADWIASAKEDVRADLKWLEGEERCFVSLSDERYPALLREVEDAPIGLYVYGEVDALHMHQLAIVGSRNPTPAGRENAAHFAAELVQRGLTITSGLACGVDAASHRGALAVDGFTVAVCGTGLDSPYPRANAALAAMIVEHGVLVSEFPIGTPPVKSNFPRRNRIISGLSLGTLVVEAAVRSGSLITARLAAEQGREVFAIPGSIHNALAKGCHRLLREGAKLVESADDVVAELPPLAPASGRASPPQGARNARKDCRAVLDKEYEILLDALGFEPASVDALIARSGLKADAVASMLLILELDGRIESYPGGLYVQRASRSEALSRQ